MTERKDAKFFVNTYGMYKLNVACPNCGVTDGWDCYPGKWPVCWRCSVTVIRYGRTPEADCVTPNGRIDSHMTYVKNHVCAFCGKDNPSTPPTQEDQVLARQIGATKSCLVHGNYDVFAKKCPRCVEDKGNNV